MNFSKGSGYSKGDLKDSGTPIILYGRLYTNYETEICNIDTFVDTQTRDSVHMNAMFYTVSVESGHANQTHLLRAKKLDHRQ